MNNKLSQILGSQFTENPDIYTVHVHVFMHVCFSDIYNKLIDQINLGNTPLLLVKKNDSFWKQTACFYPAIEIFS